jgi:nucleotide-binding universal stress UspA family protein
MFRTILLPLDGSLRAEAAYPIAVRLAKGAGAKLHLLMVHHRTPVLIGMGAVPVSNAGLEEEVKACEMSYLAELLAELGPVGDGPAEVHYVYGTAGTSICEEAARLAVDLVVMATHGRGAAGRFWLGSVADYVVRHMTAPVLLVHSGAKAEASTDHPIREILVALDLSKHSESILEPATALAQLSQAHLTLLHVLEPFWEVAGPLAPYPVPQDPEVIEARRAYALRLLNEVAEPLRRRGLRVSTEAVVGADGVAGTVLRTIEDRGYDAVAITTHGAGGLRRLLLGSVADKVIRGAATPVLVLRPPPIPKE